MKWHLFLMVAPVALPLSAEVNAKGGLSAQVNAAAASRSAGESVASDALAAKARYSYGSYRQRNPFVPPLGTEIDENPQFIVTSVLQNFDLSELRLVGTWQTREGVFHALVAAKNESDPRAAGGVTVRVGDPAGVNGGHIISVSEDSVRVREYTLAPDGSRRFNDRDIGYAQEMYRQPDQTQLGEDVRQRLKLGGIGQVPQQAPAKTAPEPKLPQAAPPSAPPLEAAASLLGVLGGVASGSAP